MLFAFLFKSVGKEEVREINGPPTLLQLEFSSLASEKMQKYFEQNLPSFLSLLYLNAHLYVQSIQGKICIRVDIPDHT